MHEIVYTSYAHADSIQTIIFQKLSNHVHHKVNFNKILTFLRISSLQLWTQCLILKSRKQLHIEAQEFEKELLEIVSCNLLNSHQIKCYFI